jgi:hypothetical protein
MSTRIAAGRVHASQRDRPPSTKHRILNFLTIGHRGVMGVEPENTLRSFIAAGVHHIVLRFGGGDQSTQLERATREILPHLRA